MASLKVRIHKGTEDNPKTTITVPLGVLRVAAKLMPKRAASALEEKAIDLDQIVELSQKEDIQGTLVEIDDHKKNEKIIISIE